jgi:glyoxylase I family protein
MNITGVHHIAIIASDYSKSKDFYVDILGFKPIFEVYREESQSYKCDLALGDRYLIELFSFPNPPQRVDRPEATGLRHLCFATPDIIVAVEYLKARGIEVETVRVDPYTQEKYTFFKDPDNLPLELKEVKL